MTTVEGLPWGSVDKSDGCWVWTAGTDDDGYGVVHVQGKRFKAHRHFYSILVGDIEKGKILLHSCDNPPCVRPDHLNPGTHAQNMAEMYARGRGRKSRGEEHWAAKLTDAKVVEIRRRWSDGERQVDLAAEFGVAQQIISQVVNRKLWAHVPA